MQLYLQCDSREGVSLFDHTSDASIAPSANADSTVRSQWTTRDAVARLAVCSHLPSAERAHFGQYNTAKSLYDVVVARYSSPASAALSRLMLLRSGLRLLLVVGAAAARAREARVVEEMTGAAVVAVEDVEGVGVEVGVEAGVGALVAAVEVEAAAAAVVGVAAAVELVGVEPCSVEALAVASASSSRVPVRPCRPSSFVSGTLGVGGLGVLVHALTFSALASAVERRAGCRTLRSTVTVA
ncbi:unnamed protein product [Closterium sp. NIES-65]|nr:unnamed protein product [Closterium sp. NIES-65]